jgi:hypothetical protein
MHSLYSTITRECSHDKPVGCPTTVSGTFSFCGETPINELFYHDEACYLYTKATSAYENSGSNLPICPTDDIFVNSMFIFILNILLTTVKNTDNKNIVDSWTCYRYIKAWNGQNDLQYVAYLTKVTKYSSLATTLCRMHTYRYMF